MRELTDTQLVQQYLKKHDELALEELVQRYLLLVYGFVRNYTGNVEDSSDITQEAFVKAWKNLKSFDTSKSFKTWIFTIAKRTAIDWLKKKKALPFSMLVDETDGSEFSDSLADDSPSSLENLFNQATGRQLSLALQRLPSSTSSIIQLHLHDGLNFREIAGQLQEPLNTIKSRYRRGLALLRKFL